MQRITSQQLGLPEGFIDETKYELYIANLSEVPHEEVPESFKTGKNGLIDFHKASKNVKVLSFNEKDRKPVLADIAYWSKHYNRKVVIVELQNGLQIITDDDPRAVYGIKGSNVIQGKFNMYERFTPIEALENKVFVPFSKKILSNLNNNNNFIIEEYNSNSSEELLDFKSVISKRCTYFLNEKLYLKLKYHKDAIGKKKWSLEIPISFPKYELYSGDEIGLSQVSKIVSTEELEDGYDLTVPGYETFMSVDGIVLSNTMNVHVPASSGAVKDVIGKLMPSKQVFSIRDPQKIVNQIKQETLLGLAASAARKATARYVFRTEKDALDAIKAGKVNLNDEVEILNKV